MNQTTNMFSKLANQYLKGEVEEEKTADPEIERIIHGLQKKSEVTKLKMISELKQLLPTKNQQFFDEFTPIFVTVYKKFVDTEYEKRVLEQSNIILGLISQYGKASIQKKFKNIFPQWFIMMNDFTIEVQNLKNQISQTANQSFNQLFSKEKHSQALQVCSDAYFNDLKYYLNLNINMIKKEGNIDEDKAEQIYERLIVASIRSIATAIEWSSQLQGFQQSLIGVLNDNTLQLLTSDRPRIISSLLDTIFVIIQNKDIQHFIIERMDYLLQQTLELLDKKDRLIQNSLWKGYIIKLFQSASQEQLLKLANLEVKLIELVSKGAFGVGNIFYEKLIIFTSLCPQFITNNLKTEEDYLNRLSSSKKLLDSILLGLDHEESRFFSEKLINSYFEVYYFLLSKRLLPQIQNYQNLIQSLQQFATQSFKIIIQKALSNQGQLLYNHNPYKQVPQSIGQFFQIVTFDNEVGRNIMTQLLKELIQQEIYDYSVFVEIVKSLLKVNQNSKSYQFIQDFTSQVFDQLYNNNDIEKGSQLFEVLQQKEFLQRNDAQAKIQQILENLIQQVQVIQPQQAIKQAITTKKFIVQLERIQGLKILSQIFSQLIEKEFKQQIKANEEEQFKIKWITLYILIDENVSHNYYSQMYQIKDVQQEYYTIDKNIPKQPIISQLIQKLIQKTLTIQNMSIKIYIPSIIGNINDEIRNLLKTKYQRLQEILLQKSDNKAYLNVFEEISFVLSKTQLDPIIFSVLSNLYLRSQSVRGKFLVSLLNNQHQQLFVDNFILQLPKITIEQIDRFIHYFQDCINQLHLDSSILIQHLNFQIRSPISWKIFQIINCPQDYFKQQYDNKNFDLISKFLAANYSSFMLYDHKLKRFIQNFVSNNIKPIVLDSFEAYEDVSIEFIEYLYNFDDIVYGVALKNLVRSIQLEEQHLNIQSPQANKLNQTIIIWLQKSLDQNKISSHITLRQIIGNIKIDDQMPIDKSVESFLQTKSTQYLDIITLTLQQNDESKLLQDDAKLSQIVETMFTIEFQSNFDKMVAFDFINLVSEKITITPFAAHILDITNLFKKLFNSNTEPQKYYSFAIISALQFLRKIINFIEAFPVEFIDYLNFQLTDTLLNIIQFCIEIRQEFMDEQNDQLFIEFAETLLRVIQNQYWVNFDSTIYYKLLQSPFISIQKAAFLALQMKKAKLDKQQVSEILNSIDLKKEEIRLIKSDDEDIEDVITFPLKSSILTHLLTWLTVLQHEQKSEFRDSFDLYLENLCYILNFLTEQGVQPRFTYREVYSMEIDLIVLQDDQSELLKLVVISFYQFIIAQQAQFKSWHRECSQQQRKEIEDMLIYISKAIYLREVEIIELKQDEWRQEGFEIFAIKHNQEILASYQKEEQKIEVLITMPNGFPLKQLRIEAKKGVKLGEDKIRKWALMIRQILQNNNDTILDALKLWKLNIDKQFEGLEECAICYYVIHQTGELPKMACRTCKHKFHSCCIQKWFQTSNKSDCPLCKSQFL